MYHCSMTKLPSTKKKRSRIIIIIILLLLAVVTVGLIVWYSITQTQDTNAPQPEPQPQSQTPADPQQNGEEPAPSAQYIVLEDWGVQLEQPESIEVTFYKGTDDGIDYYEFSTKNVEALGDQCIAGGDDDPAIRMARLVRETDNEGTNLNSISANNGEPLNGYYFYVYGSQSLCSENGRDIQTEERVPLIEMLKQPMSLQ